MASATRLTEPTSAPSASSASMATHLSNGMNGDDALRLRNEAGPSRMMAIPSQGSSSGRPASKSRRMSSGGSRMPAEEQDGRKLLGRSTSDSGSDWPHIAKQAPASGGSEWQQPVQGQSSMHNDNPLASSPQNFSAENGNAQAAITATDELAGSSHPRPHLNLATFPPQDLLRVLAALLHQIAVANDELRPPNGTADSSSNGEEGSMKQRERNADPEMALMTPAGGGDGSVDSAEGSEWFGADSTLLTSSSILKSKPTTAAMSALQTPSSTLCFRARNIPSISIEAYLLRILRYCPASCEVFVSLLVYFDRMSKMGQKSSDIGDGIGNARKANSSIDASGHSRNGTSSSNKPDSQGASEFLDGNADADHSVTDHDAHIGMRGFAIDSFNVHRLVIAGVTVASKFFSDVFYTNSRYAKVGGLPVHELNQLELQFLLLNDFNLMIPSEEMQRYADQLLVYGGAARPSPALSPVGEDKASSIASGRRHGTESASKADAEMSSSSTDATRGETVKLSMTSSGSPQQRRSPTAPKPSHMQPQQGHGDTSMGVT